MIYWVLGNYNALNSGVSKYSTEIIKELKGREKIKEIFVPHLFYGKLFYVGKYLYLPFYIFIISIFNRNAKLILPDESYSFYYMFSFFFKRKIIIIHDLRKVKSKTIREKIKHIILSFNCLFIKFFNNVICVSNFTEKELKNKFRISNTSVIYNAIELKKNEVCNVEVGKYSNIFKKGFCNIIYLGSHESRKNTLLLLDAFLSLEYSKLNLVVAGRYIDSKNYNAFLARAKGANNVFCLGEVDTVDLSYLLESSDFFITASTFEGFGRTPVEAQYLGIPVISTYNTGMLESLTDNSFIKIDEPLTNESIRSAIINALNASELELGNLISAGSVNALRFTPSQVASKFESVINEKNSSINA